MGMEVFRLGLSVLVGGCKLKEMGDIGHRHRF